MAFVLDSNCFNALDMYFPSRFPSFWQSINASVAAGLIVSVKEVYKELNRYNPAHHTRAWIELNKEMFRDPTEPELARVAKIFADVPRFQDMVRQKQILSGSPVADPFLIAAAWEHSRCVVTAEKEKKNSATIPTACSYFDVRCTDFEGMMTAFKWSY